MKGFGIGRVAAAAIWATLAELVLAGCTQVVETTPLVPGPLGYAPTCHTALGAYYLPKVLLGMSVVAAAGESGQPGTIKATPLAPTVTVDNSQTLCLDYLGVPNAADIVTVNRKPNGLLQKVYSNVTDQTPAIVNNLVDAGANLLVAAAREARLGAAPGDKLDLQVDPFDWDDLMRTKIALRRFGLCLYVEGYSFPITDPNPRAIREAAERWCETVAPRPFTHPAQYYASLPVPPEVMGTGILYRPKMTHKVVLMSKGDPHSRNRWLPYYTTRVDMPNISPVLSFGVERALFTNRLTTVYFDDGVLTDVSINKGSELLGFVSIPIVVAKAIVSVPAQIVQFRILDTQNQTRLLNAQGELIQAVAAYQATVSGSDNSGGTPKSAKVREGTFVGSCIDAGAPAETCRDIAQSPPQ
jgi:hypothetical protein